MQNARTQARPFPSSAAIAAGLLAIIAAAVLLLYFSTQLGHAAVRTSSGPVVTQSVGSELVRQNTSERNAVSGQPSDPGVLRPHGPR